MSRTPNGRIDRDTGGKPNLVITRRFQAPIEDVWASITESTRLERWIGTFTGDAASGRIAFRMTAESADAPEEDMEVLECDPPRLLVVRAQTPNGYWPLRLALTEDDGGTELTFTQTELAPDEAESVGPGWEYYLDRLVAAVTGGTWPPSTSSATTTRRWRSTTGRSADRNPCRAAFAVSGRPFAPACTLVLNKPATTGSLPATVPRIRRGRPGIRAVIGSFRWP